MAKITEEQIARMKQEMKELKAKVLSMQEKKKKSPKLFSKLEDMQLANYIKAYNSMVAKARALNLPLFRPGK